jgi:hypothetical protein
MAEELCQYCNNPTVYHGDGNVIFYYNDTYEALKSLSKKSHDKFITLEESSHNIKCDFVKSVMDNIAMIENKISAIQLILDNNYTISELLTLNNSVITKLPIGKITSENIGQLQRKIRERTNDIEVIKELKLWRLF